MKSKIVWGLGIGCVLIAAVLCWLNRPNPVWQGILWGGLISSFLNLLGFIAVRYTFIRSFKKFFAAIVGGILIRMVVMLAGAFYLRQYPSISIMWFLLSFLGFFMIYQVMEIFYFHFKISRSKT